MFVNYRLENIERVTDSVKLAEGPHWDVETQTLYYVDIIGQEIHKYKPATCTHTHAYLGAHVSFIIPIDGAPNKFLTGSKRDIQITAWDGISEKFFNEKIAEVDVDSAVQSNTINDGKCDALGRLWTGTVIDFQRWGEVGPNMGSVYSMSSDRSLKSHVGNITCSNGLAWNADNTKFYYTDTYAKQIWEFDFDLQSGSISNKTVVFSTADLNISGMPDGLTIDSDGNLWTAIFPTPRVIQFDPKRKNTILREVTLPVKQVTSVTFGGEKLDELYVTTGRVEGFGDSNFTDADGAVYKVTGLGVCGLPAVKAKIC